MTSLIIICIGIAVSWQYTDLHSSNPLYGVLAPIAFAGFVLALIIWLLTRSSRGRGYADGGSCDIGYSSWGSDSDCGGGGGDSGGCD